MKPVSQLRSISLTITAGLACCFIGAGCDSDDALVDAGDSRRELLTAEAWVLQSVEVEPDDGTVEVTWTADRFDFRADGRVIVTAEDGSTETGTWRFEADETEVVLIGGGTSATWSILVLDEDLFRSEIAVAAAGVEAVIRMTLVHP